MRLNRLLSSLLGALSFQLLALHWGGRPVEAFPVEALPVGAARLQFWRFEARENRLVFTTDSGVQPRAQLIFNPTRIIIDLPRTTLGDATASQAVGGGVREVRVGQFNADTTRLVIELSPGYTVDPQQVQVRGETSRQWIVQLPRPERGSSPPYTPPPASLANSAANQVNAGRRTSAATQIDGIVATPDGFFIRTSGEVPEIEVQRSSDRAINRQIIIDTPNTTISPALNSQNLPNQRYSVKSWEVTQLPTSPPGARVILNLGDHSPDWRATTSSFGGIVILPVDVSISQVSDIGDPGSIRASATPPSQQTHARPRRQSPRTTPSRRRSNTRVVVVIDPGHGGRDPGAVGIGGLQEKGIVLEISRQVASRLEEQGIQAVLTRRDDRWIDLDPRIQIAENVNADLFISIHANAVNLSRPDVNGLESYYYSDVGYDLAQTIHTTVLRSLGSPDRGIRQSRFYLLRNTSMPAVLIETGFLTGAQDAPNLANPSWRRRMADAIAQGISQYVRQNLQ